MGGFAPTFAKIFSENSRKAKNTVAKIRRRTKGRPFEKNVDGKRINLKRRYKSV